LKRLLRRVTLVTTEASFLTVMRAKPNLIFLILLTGSHSQFSYATESIDSTKEPLSVVMTLVDCIRRGLANSPGLEVADYEREVVEKKLAEARAAYFLPEIKLRILGGPVPDVPDGSGPDGNFPNVETKLSDFGPFIQARIEAIQPIFTFGKLSGLEEAAKKGVEAKKAQERAVRNELIQRVKNIYNSLVYLYSLKDFLEELQDRSRKAREKVEEQLRKHSPDVTEIDRMRLDVFFSETERRLIELRNGIHFGLSTMSILTGIPSVDIADKMLKMHQIEVRPLDYYLSRAKMGRPEIQQLANAVRIKKALIKVSKADFFPTLFIGGFYGYGNAPGRQDVDNPFLKDDFNFNSGGVALGLEQKLGFHLTNSRYEQAMSEYRQVLAQEKLALQGIEIQIRKTYSDVISKRDAAKSSENAFKAGRSWVLATTLNFGVGLVPVKDLLEAFVAYSKVKVGYLDIIYDSENAIAELSKVVGEEVSDLQY